jgi:5-methylcytosine-specific restriction enzyme subunit McrC
LTEIVLREWQRVPLPRSSFGPAEHAALGQLPGHAYRLQERGGQFEFHARAHVGRVQVGGLTITVLPKLAERPLLNLFHYAYDLGNLTLGAPTAYPGGALLQDIFAEQLRRHVQMLVDRGLYRSYQRVALDLTAPRGRIDMAALARRTPLLRPVLPCVTHDRSVDHTLNQVLHAGLIMAARIVSYAPLRARLRELAACLADEITVVPLTRTLIAAARRSLHRLVGHYRPALQLIELLYAGAGLDLVADSSAATAAGFLFDMNRFFQALVLRLLQEGLVDCEVEHEQALRNAYRWAAPRLPGRRRPRPRPDIAVLHRGRRFLLDAKYRDLSIGPLPREILYQLTMYAASQGTGGTAAMIYPRHEAATLLEERLDLFDPIHAAPHATLYLRPVPLLELAASLDAGEPGIAFRRRLARTLALGSKPEGVLDIAG